jgi:hypothetical protein
MSASASFGDVCRMLNECAPGHTLRVATHARVVKYNGKTYPSLPKYPNIELGHIRKMVRYLEINRECAEGHIPNL